MRNELAIATVALFVTATQLEARLATTVTQFCEDRVCSTQDAKQAQRARPARNYRSTRRAVVPRAIAPEPSIGSSIIRSRKTGATAHVAPAHRAKFQAYLDDLENNGATIRFIGGIRRGPCWSGGLHPCGEAVDVCQLSRGSVDRRCNLPSRSVIASIAKRHGLFEGGQWCDHDYGHAQVRVTAGACGSNLYAAITKYKSGRKHKHFASYARERRY